MRFAQKMTLSLTLLLALLISVGGTLLVRRSFRSALDTAITQSTAQHLLEKYTIEADLLTEVSQGRTPGAEHLRRYADSITGYFTGSERLFALYGGDYETIFSNLPAKIRSADREEALRAGGESCILRKAEDKSLLLMASRIDTPYQVLWLLSAFDVSAVFADRTRQLNYLWQMEAVLLACGILLTSLISWLLTRNVKKLSLTAHQIAGGAYVQRTKLRSRDEIGGLARDFDRMAFAIQEKVEGLQAAVQSRDDFVTAFSHEMKTPMTALIGYAGILRTAEEEPAVRRLAADHIFHEARRLETLSQKLLELMGLSRDSIQMEPVLFRRIHEDMLRSLSPDTKHVSLDIQGSPDVRVLADRTLCADLLHNLVINGLKAGGGTTVRVHVRRGRIRCSVMVCDGGQGIPEPELKRITEPFYMVDRSRARQQGGSGVGLTLSLRIAGLHGSGLRFRSTVGRGTIVRFTLPCALDEVKA